MNCKVCGIPIKENYRDICLACQYDKDWIDKAAETGFEGHINKETVYRIMGMPDFLFFYGIRAMSFANKEANDFLNQISDVEPSIWRRVQTYQRRNILMDNPDKKDWREFRDNNSFLSFDPLVERRKPLFKVVDYAEKGFK